MLRATWCAKDPCAASCRNRFARQAPSGSCGAMHMPPAVFSPPFAPNAKRNRVSVLHSCHGFREGTDRPQRCRGQRFDERGLRHAVCACRLPCGMPASTAHPRGCRRLFVSILLAREFRLGCFFIVPCRPFLRAISINTPPLSLPRKANRSWHRTGRTA